MGNDGPGDQVEIRYITEDDLPAWDRALTRGFLRPHIGVGGEFRSLMFEPNRFQGAFDPFDPTRCVATFRSFDTELTVPGGGTVLADAVSAVTVNSTHTRRGLLTRMMATDLADAAARGCAVAILLAAEYTIYGRFGFGPASRIEGLKIDVLGSRGIRDDLPRTAGRVDFVSMAEYGKVGPELYDRWRPGQPGAIERKPYRWKMYTGEVAAPGYDWKEPFVAVHRDEHGTVTGLVAYKVDDTWDGGLPNCTLTVMDFIALDPTAAVALWRLVFSVDWVRTVVVENLGADDPLPYLLTDPRYAVPGEEYGDATWLRLLDVPAAFAARTYAAPGRVVLEVTDRQGYAAGRWALTVAEDGTGRAERTEDPAELALDAAELGALYLGSESASRRVPAGLVTELRPGAAATADLLLRTPLRAWNPEPF
ncbi:GNAT family N-acetyltransferase [Kitasatospora sp. NPDC096147]|uniref:GNAT family N-acetyltransferase n=1 Tax=Kitasatospora sp. NPDC096147 TaxID=3364093 RepID=UPI00381EE739